MNSRHILLLPLLLLANAATAQLQPPDITIRPEAVAPGVWVLFGSGGNIGVSAGPDGVLLVDDQFAPLTPKIEAAVRDINPGSIRFVLNTHWHGDHTGGNEALAGKGALVIAQDGVRRRLSSDNFNEFLQNATPAAKPGAWPIITFNEEMSLHLNGEDIRIIHVPQAHTDGDAVVHFRQANVMHLGDLYFNGLYPFIDVDSGGSWSGLLAAVERVLEISNDETRFIPGHGPMSNRADLVAYRDMLATTGDRMRRLILEGQTLEQITASAPFAEYDEQWHWAFITKERYLQILHRAIKLEIN